MRSFGRVVTLLLPLAGPAGASRVRLDAELSAELGENATAELGGDLIDLTDFLKSKSMQKKGSKGNKCCCDASGDSIADKYRNAFSSNAPEKGAVRSGRCMIFENTQYCKDVDISKPPASGWAKGWLSGTKNSKVPCMVDPEDMREVYRILGSGPDYCDFKVWGLKLSQPKAAIGAEVSVECGDEAYAPASAKATCVFGTAALKGGGVFEPTPACVPKIWCTNRDEYQGLDGHPVVEEVGQGEPSKVTCAERGWKPKVATGTCQESKYIWPYPECVKIEMYCMGASFPRPGAPMINTGRVGESEPVYCQYPGWEMKQIPGQERFEVSTCYPHDEQAGEWWPPVECEKAEAFCPGNQVLRQLQGHPHLGPARVDERIDVTCTATGWENNPRAGDVLCKAEESWDDDVEWGQPKPRLPDQPLCTMVRDYCKGVQGAGEGGASVRPAELGGVMEVLCDDEQYAPVETTVTCQEDGTWSSEPACSKI